MKFHVEEIRYQMILGDEEPFVSESEDEGYPPSRLFTYERSYL